MQEYQQSTSVDAGVPETIGRSVLQILSGLEGVGHRHESLDSFSGRSCFLGRFVRIVFRKRKTLLALGTFGRVRIALFGGDCRAGDRVVNVQVLLAKSR